jgi:hypothetical protein
LGYERLVYAGHALRRMRERRIFEVEILRVPNEADLRYPSYGKQVAEDVLGIGRVLRIVYVDTPRANADARIISAIDLKEAE